MHSPPDPVTAPVAGSDERFAVRRVFCVGRNYADHAREMGMDPDREPPFFFTKWAETVALDGATIPYPQATQDLHHEAELVVAIGGGGANVSREAALEHVFGYACGIDFTRRDLQAEAKKDGRPWDTAKNFAHAAPLGTIHPASSVGHLKRGAICLKVNGATRQSGDLAQMIWPVPDIIAYLSRLYMLGAGDLIYTGTPAGVGPVLPGDKIEVGIDGLSSLTVTIGELQE